MTEMDPVFARFCHLFNISLDHTPDIVERALMDLAVRNIVEARVRELGHTREDIETLVASRPDTSTEAGKALEKLNELRSQEKERSGVVQSMLLTLGQLEFNTAGWNTAAPELVLPTTVATETLTADVPAN